VVLGMAITSVPGVAADPISDKRAQAAQLASELDRLNTKQEQLAEKFNGARVAADRIQAQVVQANAAVAKANVALGKQRAQLRDIAVTTYVEGGSHTAADAATVDNVAVSRFYVAAINSRQRDALDALEQAKSDYQAEQARLRDAQARAKDAIDAVAKNRQAAAAAAAQQQAALSRAQGELATLVAEDQARKAAAEAARVKAELERQQQLAAATAASRARAAAQEQAAAAARAAAPAATRAAPTADNLPAPGHGADAAIAEARRQLGKPYEWGAAGPGSFDCSGLTMWAWRAGGVSLPHYTMDQYNATTHVPLSDIQPGDLIFFGSDFHHVGLYVGGGQMIEAPHSGADVRYASIYRSDLEAASRPNP
jgi:cell wall-associated NlpC family hydrolase